MIPESLGQRIRQARRAKEITQEQLAARLYVTRQTVSNWENARTQPDYETLKKLADMLDVRLTELLGQTYEEAPEKAPDGTPAGEAVGEPAQALQDEPEKTQDEAAGEAPEEAPEKAPDETPAGEDCGASADAVPLQGEPLSGPAGEKPLLSAESEVVQPWIQTVPRYVKALLGVLLCCALAAFAVRAAEPTPEAFMREVKTREDQAYITIYAKNIRVGGRQGSPYLRWNFNLCLREDHGVGFQIEELRYVWFLEDGGAHTDVLNAADIASTRATSHINGYGLLMQSTGYGPDAGRVAHPTGVGVMLKGWDDSGSEHTFYAYVPFEPVDPIERVP